MPPGHVRTICVLGFPPDALPRELKNLCRCAPGFEGAHVAYSGAGRNASALFVKFRTPEQASHCLDRVHGMPFDGDSPDSGILKAEFARREMEVRQNGATSMGNSAGGARSRRSATPAPQPPPGPPRPPPGPPPPPPYASRGRSRARPALPEGDAARGPPWGDRYSSRSPQRAKRARHDGPELDTIAVLSVREKGLSEDYLHSWFSRRSGFLALHMNDRINAAFVKFSSGAQAEASLRAANDGRLGAEWARRNLDL